MSYRNTYSNVYLKNIEYNVNTIINNYTGYKYYIGVVKADCYGHNTSKTIQSILDGGCNYLAVSSLDEALEIRKDFDIPILCLGVVDKAYLKICEENNIDITVASKDYFDMIRYFNLNIHIKVDTGMNRLGVKDKESLNYIYKNISDSNLKIKGIYTHIFNAVDTNTTDNQIEVFKNITSDIDLNKIDMVHIAQSDTLVNHSKIDFCNGCRIGILMYGLTNNNLNLKNTIDLCSEIIDIKYLSKGETVSYNGNYTALEDEIIGIVSIGYADGVNRKFTGSKIYINDKEYTIVGNICMDMLMVKIDDSVKIHDIVYIYKDIDHINYMSEYIDTIPYELICNISKRVPRYYQD